MIYDVGSVCELYLEALRYGITKNFLPSIYKDIPLSHLQIYTNTNSNIHIFKTLLSNVVGQVMTTNYLESSMG